MLPKKVVVGLSGGVDSSMVLFLLQKQGYTPVALTFKLPNWEGKIDNKAIESAGAVCKKLGIEHHVIDKRKDFKKTVVSYFNSELKAFKTPNPCVVCNRSFKFKALFEFADKHNIRYVATGHYARIKDGFLCKPRDKAKDQTYGLCLLKREWLSRLIFPLQDLTKDKVYELASKQGFSSFSKLRQSQDFCFVSGKALPRYLEKELGYNEGEIVDTNRNVLGRHKGLWFYTLGQRKGLGRNGKRYFVCGLDKRKNQLIVSDTQRMQIKEILLQKTNLLCAKLPSHVKVKLRYSSKETPAVVYLLSNRQAKVVFNKPQAVVTPGQFCVFYSKGKCLGGGIIK